MEREVLFKAFLAGVLISDGLLEVVNLFFKFHLISDLARELFLVSLAYLLALVDLLSKTHDLIFKISHHPL